MQKILLIFFHEIRTLVWRKSFWFGVLGVPLIAFAVYAGVDWLVKSQGGADGSPNDALRSVERILKGTPETRPQGFIDQAGLIRDFPPENLDEILIAYEEESQAREALEKGVIGIYYIIPPDYVQSGKLYAFSKEINLIEAQGQSITLQSLINYSLVGEDLELFQGIHSPLAGLSEVNLSPDAETARDMDNFLTLLLPYGVMVMVMMSILGTASLLLSSLAKEKENRVMEVLLMSATPNQFLLGKIAGLGLVGLFQVTIYAVSGLALLRLSGKTFDLPEAFMLDPSILGWGVIFFVLGYLLYAALMAGVGALVPNLREASQASFIISAPMMIPLALITALIDAPNGPLAAGLSLFPFTSSTTMMMRLATAPVPLWQLLLAIVLQALAARLVIRLVAGLFRAQNILSGQMFSLKRFFLALVGRA